MALLRITKYGEPVLRKVAKPVEDLGPKTQELIRDMFETMYAANGVGLAAPQIGLSLRLAVINVTPDEKKNQVVIINPVIVKKDGRAGGEEGCLSLPGVGGAKVKRAERVTVTALNEKGLPITIKAEGILARCLQHEIEHLNGKLILHRAPLKRRLEMSFAIRRLKKEKLW
ncbi:MAG: peptide deformylase [Elusimicrobia bacterium]|nr:peptide deformylase [Candidatus Obscuribacterium magneticum]MCB4756370.1 peptide deformylase [Candidatus Obscuribacterium magneticum]